jgi:DNA-binding MarR family transcriptional regulator
MSASNETTGNKLPEIDKLIHEPSRYNIMALLYVIERAEFLFVQNQTKMTSGNLSTHLNKLEEAGYIEIDKGYAGKIPKTFLKMTVKGNAAFEDYRNKMKVFFNTPPGVRKDYYDK